MVIRHIGCAMALAVLHLILLIPAAMVLGSIGMIIVIMLFLVQLCRLPAGIRAADVEKARQTGLRMVEDDLIQAARARREVYLGTAYSIHQRNK